MEKRKGWNVLTNVRTAVKGVMEKKLPKTLSVAFNLIRTIAVSVIALAPTIVMAAGASPQGQLITVLDGITSLLLFVAPTLGGLAFIWHGLQFYLAGDAHKKADTRDSMKSTVLITAIIMMATTIIKWIASLAG
jgi:hypothetical protein